MNSVHTLFGNIHFILKLVEFVLCLAGMATIYSDDTLQMKGKFRDPIVVAQTVMCYVLLALIVVYILHKTHKLFEVFILIVGIVHNVCGLVFAFWYYYDNGNCKELAMYAGIFLSSSAGVMLCDVLTFLRRKQLHGNL